MEENVRMFSCGGCGCSKMKLYSKENDFMKEMFIECTGCKSVTVLSVMAPKIKIDWARGEGEGTICFM